MGAGPEDAKAHSLARQPERMGEDGLNPGAPGYKTGHQHIRSLKSLHF